MRCMVECAAAVTALESKVYDVGGRRARAPLKPFGGGFEGCCYSNGKVK
jgi:hypothetical protein